MNNERGLNLLGLVIYTFMGHVALLAHFLD